VAAAAADAAQAAEAAAALSRARVKPGYMKTPPCPPWWNVMMLRIFVCACLLLALAPAPSASSWQGSGCPSGFGCYAGLDCKAGLCTCQEVGSTCWTDASCCGSLSCGSLALGGIYGICEDSGACKGEGKLCASDGDCCSGFECINYGQVSMDDPKQGALLLRREVQAARRRV
jgi:hypothetical protein